MKLLITGGAGSLGKCLTNQFLLAGDTVRVLDINEAELASLSHPNLRRLYGNVCDPKRVELAMREADAVIHTAAIKNISISEYNPEEAIKTNVLGTQNIIDASLAHKVPYNIFISSDKAVYPTTLYGTTKLMGEHLWKWAQEIQVGQKFCIFRPGNFHESRGNVFEVWEQQHQAGLPLTLTDENMERYFIETERAAELVRHVLGMMQGKTLAGGEVVVPKMKTHKILDLLRAKYPGEKYKVIGLRKGEKLKEILSAKDENKISADNAVEVFR